MANRCHSHARVLGIRPSGGGGTRQLPPHQRYRLPEPTSHGVGRRQSGTSGTIAIQYAKHLGAEVTGVCSAEKVDLVRSLGADKTPDYTHKDSISKLEAYDLVLDSVGKARTSELKQTCRSLMSDNRKFVSIDDSALILNSDRLNRIRELVEAGIVRPITDRCFPFAQIIDAHRYVERGHKRGNVAITVN